MKSPHRYSTPSSSRFSAPNEEHRNGTNSCTVFVGFVPPEMEEFELGSIFSRVGLVRDVKVLRDHFTGLSRECAFVRFDSENCAKKATEIQWFCDPSTNQRMVVRGYDAKLAGKGNFKKNGISANEVRRTSPLFVQVDDISSTVEMPRDGEKVPEKTLRRNWLDDKGKAIAMREHLEEIESRTDAENKAIFVARFMQNLNEWHIRKVFSGYGTITHVKMFQTAFRVEFAHKRMAAIAIRSMNGKEYGETGKIFICDWWAWTKDERRAMKRCPSRAEALSKSPTRRNEGEKRAAESEHKRSKSGEEKAIFLPLTKKSLPPPPSPFEYLSTSESENEIENGQSEEAKLAQEFSEKRLPVSERMKAILKLIRPKVEEE